MSSLLDDQHRIARRANTLYNMVAGFLNDVQRVSAGQIDRRESEILVKKHFFGECGGLVDDVIEELVDEWFTVYHGK